MEKKRPHMKETLGDYTLLQYLEKDGSMHSKVRVAQHQTTHETVVVKYYHVSPSENINRELRKLITYELTTMNQLDHPGVIKCFSVGEAPILFNGVPLNRVYYLVMECVHGKDLRNLLIQAPLSPSLILHIFAEVCNVFQYIHSAGFAHLDIKLDNILITNEGNVKIIDFGMSRRHKGPAKDGRIRTYQGTKGYKAPEINATTPFVGHEADVFALGVVLFIMHVRRYPFGEDHTTDKAYAHICHGEYEEFWEYQKENTGKEFPAKIKELIIGMLLANPVARLSLPEVIAALKVYAWQPGTEGLVKGAIKKWMRIE